MRPATKLALISAAQRVSVRLPPHWDRRLRELAKIALNYRGDRKTAGRHVRYRLARWVSPIVVAPFGDGCLLVDARDEEIGRTVFLRGGYERWHMEAALEQMAARGLTARGRTFLDVGANIGTSTVDALLHFGFQRALCFEPLADNVRLLRLNILLNGLEWRADVFPVALSNQDGAARLECSTVNFGDQRVCQVAAGPIEPTGDDEWVDCRRLDAFVDDGVIDPDQVGLLWIDTQGHEPRILEGAKRLLEAGVPTVVEYCPWLLLERAAELEELIAEHFGTVVDLRAASAGVDGEALLDPSELPRLRKQYAAGGYTDLLLLP